MDLIILIFLSIILNFGKCADNGPFSSDETFLSEENCSADGTSDSEFWAWIRQQSDLFVDVDDKQDDGMMQQFLQDLEQEEQHVLFPPPVIHPIAEKYTHQTFESDFNNNKSSTMETNNEKAKKWSNSFKRFGNIFDKFNAVKTENEQNEIKAIQKSGEKEKFENLMQILRNDAVLLKRTAFLAGHCAVKSSNLFSGIKHRLYLAVDLLSAKFGITQIVPMNIPHTNGKILKILALKWMKMRKLKNEKGNGEKGQKKQKKYVEELLKLIKGFLEGPQFDMLTNNGHATKSQKKRRRRRQNKGVIFGLVAFALCLIVIGVVLIVTLNQREDAEQNVATLEKAARKAAKEKKGNGAGPANGKNGAGPAKNGGGGKPKESPSPKPPCGESPFVHTCGRTD